MLEEKKLQTDFTKSPKYFSFGTQPIVPHVKFTWKELHVKFTWNPREIRVKWKSRELFHVNFTWNIFTWNSCENSHDFHTILTWNPFHVKFMWINSCEFHVKFQTNLKQPWLFFSRCVFYFSTGWELLNSIYNTFDYTKVIYNQITVMHNNKNPLAI